jgi:hypothetical protein
MHHYCQQLTCVLFADHLVTHLSLSSVVIAEKRTISTVQHSLY